MQQETNILSEIGLSEASTISSLKYARHIQDALLCNRKGLTNYFGDVGLIYQPKNILSGDMYFYYRKGKNTYLAVCDCTGHGVSGALLTILCHNMLERTLKKHDALEDVFHHLNRYIKSSFSKDVQEQGMDMVMVKFFDDSPLIEFCGAYRPLWILNKEQLFCIKGNKCSIGSCKSGSWKVHKHELEEGDKLLLFSDGLVDQFCENDSSKFGVRRLRNLIKQNKNLSPSDLCVKIEKTVSDFKGDSIQIDDNLLLCVEYKKIENNTFVRESAAVQ